MIMWDVVCRCFSKNYTFFLRYTKNVVPFSDVWKHIFPPLPSTMFFEMASPSPIPVLFVVKLGTKTLSRTSGAMPGPLSEKDISTQRVLWNHKALNTCLRFEDKANKPNRTNRSNRTNRANGANKVNRANRANRANKVNRVNGAKRANRTNRVNGAKRANRANKVNRVNGAKRANRTNRANGANRANRANGANGAKRDCGALWNGRLCRMIANES